jgi:hypothetical protein
MPLITSTSLSNLRCHSVNKLSETFVNTILIVLVAASQLMYEAKNTTFGCYSVEDVSELQSVRSDEKAFQMAFLQKRAYGDCVDIPQGTVVEGSIEPTDTSKLLVLIEKAPPPFEAPLEDFELKAASDGK